MKLRPEDIPALIRKARRFLEAADRDIRAEDYTSALSRMYYAMFHGAQAILLAKGFRFSSHKGVISGFGRHIVKAGLMPVESARWLNEAFNDRMLADYAPSVLFSPERVRHLRERAALFLMWCEDLLIREGWLQVRDE